ncbi:MAG: SUMF1/EgtB/PvdO family nonheme iron enzyme [Chitinophagaceae bacterium]
MTQGHYRIGSREESFAYDNEFPPQAVELSSFRIAQLPVTNAEFLGFMAEGGYARPEFWDAEGQAWLTSRQGHRPLALAPGRAMATGSGWASTGRAP